MKRISVLAGVFLLLGVGCGGEVSHSTFKTGAAQDKAAGGKEPAANAEAAKPRKIVYNANATLVVDDFDAAEKQLKELLEQYHAYIAKADLNVSPNSRRNGTWTIRVPAPQLESFLDEVGRIGELHQRTLDSRDITDEFYDLESRIKNKLARQEALRELLKKKTDKVEDLLAVDRELAKVTEDIEAAQGQMQRWKKETEFATVTLSVRDRRDYVPPASPAFGTTVSRAWGGSIDALVAFCKGVVVFMVVLVPWLPVLALVIVPFVWLVRRALRGPRPLVVEAAPPMPPV
jgi:hypothetical protein